MKQYLELYAEPESRTLGRFPGRYKQVVCIPAFAEAPDFFARVTGSLDTTGMLFIVVVNAHQQASAAQLEQTRAIVSWLKHRYALKAGLTGNTSLLTDLSGTDILLVDRAAQDCLLETKAGVGMARKIACDIGCRLIADGNIDSPWIHSTDADAILPPDYCQASKALDAHLTSAAIYPFQHISHSDPSMRQAQALYDRALDYYVAGLQWAGSPWAFHTIGSTLVISAEHYARVRGFPIRQAGEDFYLLNKLAKTGAVKTLDTSPLLLSCRLSDRVPFGTGPAVQKILALDKPEADYLYYHPLCFVALKCWLDLWQSLWQEHAGALDFDTLRRWCKSQPEFKSLNPDILFACLSSLGAHTALEHARTHSKTALVFFRHLSNWFDAFMTLKFIHWLRDHHFPSVNLTVIQDETCLPFAAAPGRNDQVLPAWTPPQQSPLPGRPGH